MKPRWHKIPDSTRPGWYAEVDGVRIAEAHNTSDTGTDWYPWDWVIYFDTTAGGGRKTHAEDTLRAVKETVRYAWEHRVG